MVWLIVFGIAGLIWASMRRPRLWRPQRPGPSSASLPVPATLDAQPDGCWYDAVATLWFSQQGPLVHQGPGQFRCLGDQLQWLGPSGSVWVRWEGILAVHGHLNGVLIHTTDLPPMVVSVADNEVLHSFLTAWLAHTWWFDGQQWIAE